jgi:ectoine hydroxylase
MSEQVIDLYPSRTGASAGMCERRDPVLHGRAEGALSDEERKRYEREGYLFFPALIAETEVAALRAELDALARDPAVLASGLAVREPRSDTVRSVFSVHRLSAAVAQLARVPKLLSLVQEVLGGDVYIHQSRVNYKAGFEGEGFDWHSDFETWHVEDGMPRMRALSLSLSLTDNSALNGPLMVIPGSHMHYLSTAGITPPEHYKESLRRQEIGVPTHDQLRFLIEGGGICAPTGPAGSALLFDCNVMHGSVRNLTPWPRTNIFLVWNAVDNALVEPFAGLPPRPEHIASRNFTPLRLQA